MTVCPSRTASMRRACGSTNTTSPGSGGANHPAGSTLSGPRPATRLMTDRLTTIRAVVTHPQCIYGPDGVQWRLPTRRVATMRRLNGVDALLLYSEAPEIHMHTLKIGVLDVSDLDGGFTFDLFRRVAEPRLLALKPLRYQLVDIPFKLHNPMWVENPGIDFDYHVRRVSVPA